MYDELFKKPAIVSRYRAGPYTEDRERFLRRARAEGSPTRRWSGSPGCCSSWRKWFRGTTAASASLN